MRFSAGDPRVNWKFPLAFGVAGASVAFLWASSRANAPPGPAPPPRPGPPATPPAPLPSPLCPPQGARVAVVGDSFAEGLGPHLAAHAKDCGTPFFLDDARGTSVTQWTGPRLDAALAFNPSVVLVSLGGNDNTAGRLGHFLDIAASVVLRIEPTAIGANPDADLLLEPATDGLARWSPRDVAKLIEVGRDAATASLESLRKVALST